MASRGARMAAAFAALALLAGCGVPRSGPTKAEIFEGSVLNAGDAFIVAVNDRVTRATAVTPAFGFSEAFLRAGQIGADIIQPGDTLGLQVWENVDQGILAGPGGVSAVIEQVQVDSQGFIFVPYAGRIQAAGNTPEQVRDAITRLLATQTPDPQVLVRRLAGDGSTVSVSGGVGAQGVYPIERPTRTLSAMLARAGGVAIPQEIAQVTVVRGNHRGTVWLMDLFADPALDIALRPGDRIIVEADTRAFTALGATGAQSRVPFQTQTLSAVEALAQVGGLNPNIADPTGIFVFRNEPDEIAEAVLGRTDLVGTQRMVYVLDLTEPTGVFLARDFVVRDGDTVLVTEAPFAQWQRVLNAVSGTLAPIATIEALTGE